MYESQFHLMRRPFAATPDPRCFLAAGPIQAALDELVVCVEQGQGVAVVSAPAGTGKTLLCERLRTELEGRFETVFLRHASFLTRRALLQTVLADLNHTYRRQEEQELRLELVPAIRALSPKQEALVLICDEAHMLTEDLLEELRILSDLAEQGRPLVRLVLVGQPGLEETLARPGLEALNQRIRAHVCLDSFDRASALDYIDYRLTWAGGRTDEIFTPEALELICRASEGVPRCINQLCDHALLLGYVAEQKPVDADIIREALQDLRQLPLHWNESLLDPSSGRSREIEVMETDEACCGETTSAPDVQYQSFEFGADLPLQHSIVEQPEDIEDATEHDEELSESVETSDVDHAPRRPMPFMMSKSPQVIEPVVPVATLRDGEVVEEVVWDRYAAIDGGFPIPDIAVASTLPPACVEQVTASLCDTPTTAEVHSNEQSQAAPVEHSHTVTIEGFEAVCSRLDELLPQVTENPGWDSASLHSDEATEPKDEWDSLEEELGMSVCELASQIHTEIGSSTSSVDNHPAVEELHKILEANATSIEVGPSPETVSQPASRSARPFRNLFSQLRRKQQGLL